MGPPQDRRWVIAGSIPSVLSIARLWLRRRPRENIGVSVDLDQRRRSNRCRGLKVAFKSPSGETFLFTLSAT